ncbi:uncharacterized protein LOC120655382 [Panicum virgatum]|uniref:uncharacterized protein LOC120655382 n=1 Tax=Panicum virgatum TaxID=38727 RepID=UPI0019D54BBC|nr:uncharacterized protein LOC120655382 [Panicum virgatum]
MEAVQITIAASSTSCTLERGTVAGGSLLGSRPVEETGKGSATSMGAVRAPMMPSPPDITVLAGLASSPKFGGRGGVITAPSGGAADEWDGPAIATGRADPWRPPEVPEGIAGEALPPDDAFRRPPEVPEGVAGEALPPNGSSWRPALLHAEQRIERLELKQQGSMGVARLAQNPNLELGSCHRRQIRFGDKGWLEDAPAPLVVEHPCPASLGGGGGDLGDDDDKGMSTTGESDHARFPCGSDAASRSRTGRCPNRLAGTSGAAAITSPWPGAPAATPRAAAEACP